MSDFGFIGDAYTAPSIYQDAQDTINWFIEEDHTKPQGERGAAALYPTPGMTLALTLPAFPIRGMKTITGGTLMLVVASNIVYTVTQAMVYTQVGNLLTTSGPVSMDDNGLCVYIVDGVSRYAYTWTTNSFVLLSSNTSLQVTGVTMTNNGSGYVPHPAVTFTAPNATGFGSWSSTAMAWNGSIYVAVGYTGSFAGATNIYFTSPNGITWTSRTLPTSAIYQNIAWNGTVFCVATGTAQAYTSPDGITWTSRTMANNTQHYTMIWAGNQFVCTNQSNTIETSPDGTTWTSHAVTTSQWWQGLAYNGINYVAVGSLGASNTIGMYSANGTSWTNMTLPSSSSWSSVAWNGSIFVALAYNTTAYATSPDGITWTGRTAPAAFIPPFNTLAQALNVASNVFFYINSGSNVVYYSADGINWFSITISGGAHTWCVIGSTGTNIDIISADSFSSVGTGIGTTSGTYALTFTGGTGSGAAGTYTINNLGQVVSNPVITSGGNYTVIPTGVAFNYGGGVGAAGNVIGTNTEGAFLGGVRVQCVDNYFVYNRPNSQQWAATNPLGSTTGASYSTPQLSFASAFGAPGNVVTLFCVNREVFLLGEQGTEVWIDVGSFPFPFQIIPGSNTQTGCAAPYSVANIGSTFAMVSQNKRGQGMIMMNQGYDFVRISTHSVEQTLMGQTISDAIGYTYQLEGHEFYVVTFPSIDITWAFDIVTEKWHKWLSWDGQAFHRHRGACFSQFNGNPMVGDYQNGNIYTLSNSVYTDNGLSIRRLRRALHLTQDLQRQFFEELQLQFQPGVGLATGQGKDPKVMLRWSNDGGSTWSSEHWKSIGLQGKYKNRAIWRRLGMARDRIYEVSMTDPVKAVIVSANLKGEGADN